MEIPENARKTTVDKLRNESMKIAAQMAEMLLLPVTPYIMPTGFNCPTHDKPVDVEVAYTVSGWINAQVCQTGVGCAFALTDDYKLIDGPNPFAETEVETEVIDVEVNTQTGTMTVLTSSEEEVV